MYQGLELHSLISRDGRLSVSLEPVTVPAPAAGEIVVRVEATPINPSDLGLLLGPVDRSTLRSTGSDEAAVLTGNVPPAALPGLDARLGQSLPVGNEGAGTVIAAGPGAEPLVGRVVAMLAGGMYAEHRLVRADDCIVLPEGAVAADGASLFVNPLTALGFVETMRAEGHSAIVHTAAASNLGRMLVRICQADDVPLVSIVRNASQVALLRDLGAKHVLDSGDPEFRDRLADAVAATGATIAFDAINGGTQIDAILEAMETAAVRKLDAYTRYGSDVRKRVYVYGLLDPSPTTLNHRFGLAWDVGGWLLSPFLDRAGSEVVARLRRRVADEHRTTFASHYTATIGLREALDPAIVADYARVGTGGKYLIDPSR